MTAVKSSVTGDRKTMTPLHVLKEIEPDLETNASSSEDMEVKKWPVMMKEVNVSPARFHNPILRLRAEDRKIGEDIGEGLISKFGSGEDRVDVTLFTRAISRLSRKSSSSSLMIGTEH
ncbi:hypothetical protein QVD17_24718 [Tagetes erecta]|uniref:Uncharacterized protein n=1 Tax=Tagetes erecta TaxID=13708 RepID=A0AAD8KFX1_TARER|nr:hypothetical protein QVD17_24718 [Tagetes erecta]